MILLFLQGASLRLTPFPPEMLFLAHILAEIVSDHESIPFLVPDY
jgi:hypothetical protein